MQDKSGIYTLLILFSDLNLIDWSSTDTLAVALNDCVYLFNSATGDIQLLLSLENSSDYITSLKWVPNGRHIAVATSNADIQVG